MSEDKFTVIIRSSDRLNVNDNTNNCSVRLVCPSFYKSLQCKVLNFYIDKQNNEAFPNGSVVELQVDQMGLTNGSDSKNKSLKSIVFADVLANSCGYSTITFNCDNFNTKTVQFFLLGGAGTLLQSRIGGGAVTNYNGNWIVLMECVGIRT